LADGIRGTYEAAVAALRDCLPDGEAFEVELADARLGELQRSVLDATRAREELGFVAGTSLADGIRGTYEAAVAALA
ncbi:MAG: NAD-dependent epimerase/dehydratase family protein, partial [Solirubrobacterales bacterium]|nr:NAD-dependent epimerase/dehydratase family protein [Solirubrobacterales bacterium]